MTRTAPSPHDRLTIVKLLAKGQTPEFVASAMRMTREDVLIVAGEHGYPDRSKLAWAADILAKQDAADDVPEAEHTTVRDLHPTTTTAKTRPARRATATPAPTPKPAVSPDPATPAELVYATRPLIAQARKSTRARTRSLADRAEKLLELLAREVQAEIDRKKAAAARAAEEAKIRSEVARLERELAAKKALLSKSRAAAGSPAREAGVDPKTIRAWAWANGVECPAAGRVPRRVVDAYLARGAAS